MIRRLAPTLALLALGFAALAVGLWGLQRIFSQERDDARAELAARRRALEQYASEALGHELHARLSARAGILEQAARDPLADDRGLYLRVAEEQRLPRPVRSAEGQATPARAFFESLPQAPPSPDADDPFIERLALLRRFDEALKKNDRAAIEKTFRGILAHRASFVVAATRDVPYMLALLELFVARSTPQPSLLRGLIRDGLPGIEAEGLQRQLLSRRDRFSSADFAFLCDRLAALAKSVRVPSDDFSARCAESGSPAPEVPDPLDHPALLGVDWYLEPGPGDSVRGIALDLGAALAGVQGEMRDRGLLGADDRISMPSSEKGALVALAALPISVASPAWPAAEAQLAHRYQVKSALLVVCLLLALGIVLLAAVGQHRKQRYLELRSDFVSTVSHELRTPLASVRVMAETLEKRVAATPGARDYPARIIREVDSLGFLVENILSFNRLDKNRWVARKERFALDELAPALTEAALASTQARVSLSTEGLRGVTLEADRELMKMLLTNLVRNACKYNPRDEVRIGVTSERRGRALVLRVSDNASGIPPGERENIFKEFYRLRDSRAHASGSGLGLAICRRIMELHGGTIRVGASGPEGTTFELAFPGSGA